MRAAKAKRLRREHPDQPNPGRKSGGNKGLEPTYLAARQRQRERFLSIIENSRKNGKSTEPEPTDA